VADRICERLLEGRSLKAICLDRGMPAASTVFRWLAEDPVFAGRYRSLEVKAGLVQVSLTAQPPGVED
jgi:hypothetical protein